MFRPYFRNILASSGLMGAYRREGRRQGILKDAKKGKIPGVMDSLISLLLIMFSLVIHISKLVKLYPLKCAVCFISIMAQ